MKDSLPIPSRIQSQPRPDSISPQRILKRKRKGDAGNDSSIDDLFGVASPSPTGKPKKNIKNESTRLGPQRPTSASSTRLSSRLQEQSTPRKPAKDLSRLFDLSLSPSGSATVATEAKTTTGSAKRVLERSLTEPVIGTEHSPRLSESTSAAAILVSSLSPSTPKHRRPTSTPTRTYASKSRSFLVALPMSKLGSLGIPDLGKDGVDEDLGGGGGEESQESYADLRTRWGVDVSEDDFLDPSPCPSPSKNKNRPGSSLIDDTYTSLGVSPGVTNDLKTISEMRSKGESMRFHDEVGYMFEGLDSKSGIGLRRAGALEIITKLCDPDFFRKAKASDFLGRAWDVLCEAGAGHGDQVMDAILAFFVVLVARDPTSLSLSQTHRADFVSTLFNMLYSVDRSNDVLANVSSGSAMLNKIGVKKTELAQFKTLSDVVSRSGLFPENVTISTRMLMLQALLSLPPALLRSQDVSVLRKVMLSELSLVRQHLNAYLAGRSLLHDPPVDIELPSFEVIEGLLRLLDTFLVGRWDQAGNGNGSRERDVPDWHSDDELAEGLVSLCLTAEALNTTDQFHSKGKIGEALAHSCMEIALRVLVSLTHQNEEWNKRLLRQKFFLPFVIRTIVKSHREYRELLTAKNTRDVRATSEDEGQALDCLCLALGICTNLVQGSEDAKEMCREIRIDRECVVKRECIRRCCCKNRTSGLSCLAFVYTQLQEVGDQSDPTLDFLRGHLAVLFGLLMRRNVANQSVLLKALPGASDSVKLHGLLRQTREFVSVYAAFTSRLAAATTVKSGERDDEDDDGENSIWPSMTGHVDSMIRDGKAESVARDVVSLLEKLYGESRDS